MSRRVAITGASGFIGSSVAAALGARGDVAVPVRRPYDLDTLTATFRGVDVVIHLAGVVSAVREEDFYTANVDATRIVARAAHDAGKRLVHISSLAAAGPAPASAPRSESDPPAPITTYGRSKLEGERAVAFESAPTGLDWIILRPGVVYGPRDNAMRPLFASARHGLLPLVGSPTAAYTFIFIDDAVAAILAAIERGGGGEIVFVGHQQPVTPSDLLETIRAAINPSARILRLPRALVRVAASVGDWAGAATGKPATINSRRYVELYSPGFVCRVDRMREQLGVVARVDLRDGIARTMASL